MPRYILTKNKYLILGISEFCIISSRMCTFLFPIFLLIILSSCQTKVLNSLEDKQAANIKDSVKQMASIIAGDISRDGPKAWLKHFAKSPQFFMASEGKLVFPNNDSAEVFVKNFAKSVSSIHLNWTGINVDPITINLAVMRAYFHEVITDTSGHQMPAEGYFTGLAEYTPEGWKLRNLHWSLAGNGH